MNLLFLLLLILLLILPLLLPLLLMKHPQPLNLATKSLSTFLLPPPTPCLPSFPSSPSRFPAPTRPEKSCWHRWHRQGTFWKAGEHFGPKSTLFCRIFKFVGNHVLLTKGWTLWWLKRPRKKHQDYLGFEINPCILCVLLIFE